MFRVLEPNMGAAEDVESILGFQERGPEIQTGSSLGRGVPCSIIYSAGPLTLVTV